MVNFSTWVRYDVDQLLKFKISTDFDGVYEKGHVEAATWVDLSDKFAFSTGADNTPSGEVSLKEVAGAEDLGCHADTPGYLWLFIIKMKRKL